MASLSSWLTKPYQLSTHLRASVPNYAFRCHWAKAVTLSPFAMALLNTEQTAGWQRIGCHYDGDEPLVFGSVLMSEQDYQGLAQHFERVGERPVGEALLFAHPAVKRGPFAFCQLTHLQCPQAFECLKTRKAQLWARYSHCELFGHSFVVLEVFDLERLPEFKPVAGATVCGFRLRQKCRDYWYLMRMHRPIPILLLLWPVYWALWLASGGFPGWRLLIIFTLGALLMRAAGDIMNDYADREIDKHIERTRLRPMTTGRVGRLEAIVLAGVLCLMAFALVLLLNLLTIGLSFIALALALLYPYAKRITWLPQVVLGLAYNWGVIMAFAAIQNRVPPVAVFLLMSVLLWTIAYDTFYAMADQADDQRVGIKSSARLFGRYCHHVIALLQIIVWLMWWYLGAWLELNGLYFVALGLVVPLFVYQHYLACQKTIAGYIKAFSDNHWVGLVLLLAIMMQSV